MATYEVTCEFITQKTVWVTAKHGKEARNFARQEIFESTGVNPKEILVVKYTRETPHPYQFNLWKEGDE